MKTILIFCLFVILATPCSAQQVPYWIADVGCVKHHDTGELPRTVESVNHMMTHEIAECWEQDITCDYALDDEGDVVWNWRVFDGHFTYDTIYEAFDPPLKVLDYPLTTGKTWTTDADRYVTGLDTGLCVFVTLTGTVIGPTTVETALGVLDVIEVYVEMDYYHCPNEYHTFLLHDQLGDVTGLLDVTGCEIVPTHELSWGSLKSCYR